MHNTQLVFLDHRDEITQLRDKVQMLSDVLSTHQIAIWEYNIVTDTYGFTDDYFRILGLDKAGIRYRNMDEFSSYVHPDQRSLVSHEIFVSKITEFNNGESMTIRCIGNNGETIWLEDRFFSVDNDHNGNPLKIKFYCINITDKREKELKIRQLEERNRKVINALPEFMFIFDDNFFIRDVLIADESILLHSVSELMNADGRKIYSSEVSDLFLYNIGECLKDGELREIEYPLDVEGYDSRYYQARMVPFEDNRVLALIHDITPRIKHAEELVRAKHQAEESDRMKSIFLANMSHEIRTPLNAIVGFSEIIATTEDPKEKEEYVRIIEQNSNLLLMLINDILDLSRIESGKTKMVLQITDISAMLDEVGKVHSFKMQEGVRLNVVCPDKKIQTKTDRNRVTQVLFNLLSNAIKNTKQGVITLEVEEQGDWLKFSVKDTGRGIPEDQLTKIFTRFEKVNEFSQGTGLGLPICKSIVERLGGKIEIESEIDKGSTFSFSLPYYNQQEEIESNHKKILIAVSSESSYVQLKALIGKSHSILWARNGDEGVNLFLRERPELILTDIYLSTTDGVGIVDKIRSVSQNVPIVALTADAYLIEQQQAIAAGCSDVIAKPYTYEQLKDKIDKYLGGAN